MRRPAFVAVISKRSTAPVPASTMISTRSPLDPWVPLRILGLGKPADEIVQADIYLLTDRQPTMLPAVRPIGTSTNGLILDHSAHATAALLDDLRSDTGMGWVPEHGWLTKIRVDARTGELRFDLAIDATGRGAPSRVAAGLDLVAADLDVANA